MIVLLYTAMQSFIFTRDIFYTMCTLSFFEGGFYHINYYRLFVINFEENGIFNFIITFVICYAIKSRISINYEDVQYANSSLTFCKVQQSKDTHQEMHFSRHRMKSLKVFKVLN